MNHHTLQPISCPDCGFTEQFDKFNGAATPLAIPGETMAVLSTSHLTLEDSKRITPAIESGLIIGMYRDHGWLIHTGSGNGGVESLGAILNLVLPQGFDWLLLDCDGTRIDELPHYDW